jgi:hypothetical protein
MPGHDHLVEKPFTAIRVIDATKLAMESTNG